MPKILDVFHELKNGNALSIRHGTKYQMNYYLKKGMLWVEIGETKSCCISIGIDCNEECEVISMPRHLIDIVDFTDAMKALKEGKKVRSCETEIDYILRGDKIYYYESDGDSESLLSWCEIDGGWNIAG